jgi:hypothetical protein
MKSIEQLTLQAKGSELLGCAYQSRRSIRHGDQVLAESHTDGLEIAFELRLVADFVSATQQAFRQVRVGGPWAWTRKIAISTRQ